MYMGSVARKCTLCPESVSYQKKKKIKHFQNLKKKNLKSRCHTNRPLGAFLRDAYHMPFMKVVSGSYYCVEQYNNYPEIFALDRNL